MVQSVIVIVMMICTCKYDSGSKLIMYYTIVILVLLTTCNYIVSIIVIINVHVMVL